MDENYVAEAVAGLRELADTIEANPELIEYGMSLTLHRFVHATPAEFARIAMLLGPSEKSSDGAWYNVDRKFGPLIGLQVTTRRDEICTKVVVGTEEVEVEEPDPALVAAAMAEIPVVKTTKVVEKIEWQCPPSLHELAAS